MNSTKFNAKIKYTKNVKAKIDFCKEEPSMKISNQIINNKCKNVKNKRGVDSAERTRRRRSKYERREKKPHHTSHLHTSNPNQTFNLVSYYQNIDIDLIRIYIIISVEIRKPKIIYSEQSNWSILALTSVGISDPYRRPLPYF